MVMCCPLSSAGESYKEVDQVISISPIDCECSECGSVIVADSKFEYFEGTNPDLLDEEDPDDEIDTYFTCMICVEIRDHFACDGWVFGQLWQDLQDNFFPDMRMGGPCMAGLSPAAKGALVDARLEWVMAGDSILPVALPPWWRWWYGDAEYDEGRH